jgi:hypothetical protein
VIFWYEKQHAFVWYGFFQTTRKREYLYPEFPIFSWSRSFRDQDPEDPEDSEDSEDSGAGSSGKPGQCARTAALR